MYLDKKIVRISIVMIFTALFTTVFAEPGWWHENEGPLYGNELTLSGPYAKAEISNIRTELGSKPLGEMTINQLSPYWDRMDTALSKDIYLKQTSMLSFALPGAGQLRNGDTAEGLGFMALNLTVMAGTLTGAYFLLPADLRFDRLNYFNTSFQKIGDTWNSHSFNDYLPSMGTMAIGCLIDMIIRAWSSEAAYHESIAAIDSGRANIEPLAGPGYLGIRMRF
jgi:hypothetical protein